MQRADRLLCCAATYRSWDKDCAPLEDRFEGVEEGVRRMMDALVFEARESMREGIDAPEDAYLHPIDLESDEPGMVVSRKGGKKKEKKEKKEGEEDLYRRQAPLPVVTYTPMPDPKEGEKEGSVLLEKRRGKPTPSFSIPPSRSAEDAVEEARKRAEKEAKTAAKGVEREEKKMARREEAKRKREEETKEEREERLALQREKREERKRREMERKVEEEETKEEEEEEEKEHRESKKGEDGEDEEGEREEDDPRKKGKDEEVLVVDIDDSLEATCVETDGGSLALPKDGTKRRKPKGLGKSTFYASPVPHDRHLTALEACYPHPRLRDAVLKGSPSPNLVLLEGPPGTGKTSSLLDRAVEDERNASSPSSVQERGGRRWRALLCAPTNVGAANLYARAVQRGMRASILVPSSRIPADVPVLSQDPSSTFVCCTISGRSGPELDGEDFDSIYVDEAGMCMEAWVWGLLRPETTSLLLAGDVRQLPALASEEGKKRRLDRSMMERLLSLGYPSDSLLVQRRMHPDIASFPNNRFYEGRLTTEYAPSPLSSLPSFFPPFSLVSSFPSTGAEQVGTSYQNRGEAEEAVRLAKQMAEESSSVTTVPAEQSPTVVLITPYLAQCRLLLSLCPGVPVHTIDSFQGREADCVVLSVVRGDASSFWSDERRLAVATTRARHRLLVVGSSPEEWSAEGLVCLREEANPSKTKTTRRGRGEKERRGKGEKERGQPTEEREQTKDDTSEKGV